MMEERPEVEWNQDKQKRINYVEVTFPCRLHKIVEVGNRTFNLVIRTATPEHKGDILKKLQDSGYKIGLKQVDNSVVFLTLKKSDFYKLGDEKNGKN